ncbi:hypothetical protein R3P38DRAFT_2857559 [Favolaschia claudopus]|uniref:Uncharacterized protein n=1 Tax=Favolaschia claudopus TaxID=2862362 RepID=A0AAW0DG52_9AGAR
MTSTASASSSFSSPVTVLVSGLEPKSHRSKGSLRSAIPRPVPRARIAPQNGHPSRSHLPHHRHRAFHPSPLGRFPAITPESVTSAVNHALSSTELLYVVDKLRHPATRLLARPRSAPTPLIRRVIKTNHRRAAAATRALLAGASTTSKASGANAGKTVEVRNVSVNVVEARTVKHVVVLRRRKDTVFHICVGLDALFFLCVALHLIRLIATFAVSLSEGAEFALSYSTY